METIEFKKRTLYLTNQITNKIIKKIEWSHL